MNEIFSTAQGILTFVVSMLGGSSIIALITQAILSARKNKKLMTMIATANVKDEQIDELEKKITDLVSVTGHMMSAFVMQQMSSMALSADTKKELVKIASKVEDISSIKLDNTVKKALDIMTIVNPQSIVEERKAELQSKANEIQNVITNVNDKAKTIKVELEI